MRLFARAYLFADDHDFKQRFVFINADACMSSQLVTMRVIDALKKEFGVLYGEHNVAISGTHTHASAAGFLQYVVYDITSLGFVQQTFDAYVSGVVESVRMAHSSVSSSTLYYAAGELLEANINRSPTAYLANPFSERALYKYDVEKDLHLLKIEGPDGRGRGLLTWFPVHCTSMNNTNRLLSGDNKGAAEVFTEDWAAAHPDRAAPNFTAAFVQSSVGDTSPNVQGAFCLDTGLPCEAASSTCNGRNELCHGRGPAWPDDKRSTQIIGRRQAERAVQLFLSADEEVTGPIDFRHVFLDMRNITVEASNWTRAGRTCPPAMGMSFAAGTTDGPGAFDFRQGDTRGPPLWRLVAHLLHAASAEQVACQAPKPILLDTGEVDTPYAWQPSVVEISVLRVGHVVMLAVPGEFTTMAGRRLKRAVAEVVGGAWDGPGGAPLRVVLAGLTNTYSSYVTTWEEYQVQRYEGAFTIYGPHTLDAYIQEFLKLTRAMLAGQPVASAAAPPDLWSQQISLLTPVVRDTVPLGAAFGDVVDDVQQVMRSGQTASATFRTGCPRNNLRRNGTFALVERLEDETSLTWLPHATDRDWSTTFNWRRPSKLSSLSFATITWDIPEDTPPGVYRLVSFGDHKSLFGRVLPHVGRSRPFTVVAPGTGTAGEAAARAELARVVTRLRAAEEARVPLWRHVWRALRSPLLGPLQPH